MGSWLGTGRPGGPPLPPGCSIPDTTCSNHNKHQPHPHRFKTTTNKCKTTMNQAPVRQQRGLVPFSNEAKEPFFSSTWDEFDQMRNQMMEKNHGFWDKVDQDMKVKYELAAQEMGIFQGYISDVPVINMLQGHISQDIFQKCVIPSETYVA